MNKEKLLELVQFFMCTTNGTNIDEKIKQLIEDIELEHRKALRPWCISLADIGLGIIKDAQDTVWVTEFETAVDRIFNQLGLDLIGDPEQELKDFINLKADTWHERIKEKKNELPVQLELNLHDSQ